MRKIALAFLFLFALLKVQSQELATILLAADDASKLAENYVDPGMDGLMYSMNGGWFTTAKTHKKFGFDITISANAAFVPNRKEFFSFNASDYTFLTLGNNETSVNTIVSGDNSETEIEIRIPLDNGTFKVASFDMPSGIGDDLPFNAIPSPMIQFGVGLPTKTDFKLRFVPKLTFDEDIKASLLGVGLQHDVMQYFGPLKKLPLSVSVLAAFTHLKVTYDINDENPDNAVSVANGSAEVVLNTWTAQAIASLDFKLVTLYGSIGFNRGRTTAKMKGAYILTYDIEDSDGDVIGTIDESLVDPINLTFNTSGLRSTIGARLNLGFFKIFADYTLQEFNTVSGGIAFSFR